jgi:hypothetical protein
MRDAHGSWPARRADAAKLDALRWLRSQLSWERTLADLRCNEGAQPAQAA